MSQRVRHIRNAVWACIPDSLYMFVHLVLGGQSLFELDTDIDLDDSAEQSKNTKVQNVTVSLAQDLLYNATDGRIGLPNTLAWQVHCTRQLHRSKELVQLFHNAGHASYENILQVDNSLTESTLKSMNTANGAVVPPNLVPRRFALLVTMSISMTAGGLWTKQLSCHTSCGLAVWSIIEHGATQSKNFKRKYHMSSCYYRRIHSCPAEIREGLVDPKSTARTQKERFVASELDKPEVLTANACDSMITRGFNKWSLIIKTGLPSSTQKN